jgi:beta-mannosidase
VAEEGKTMKVHVTSDLVKPTDVLIRWQLEMIDGTCLDGGEQTLRARALADTVVGSYDFSRLVSADNQRKVVFVAEMWQDGILLSRSVTPFIANKHLELSDPGLQVHSHLEGGSLCVDVSAVHLARFVELAIDGADAVFSDNYFDIPAGTTVTVSTSLPENWGAASLVRTRSLYDSFA